MSQLADTLTSREAVRRAVLDDIVGRCQLAAVAMEGGPLDGIEVVTLGTLRDQVSAALLIDLPPASEKYAEVTTPAHVVVSAVCPECRLPVDIGVKLAPRLTVEGNTTELSVKAKSKAVNHMHGQQPLNVPDGQEDFGLDDIAGPVPSAELLETALLLVLPDALCPAVPSTVEMEGWSDLDKREVVAWAAAVHLVASDNDDVEIPARPEVIGGPPREDGEDDGDLEPEGPAGDDSDAPTPITKPRRSRGTGRPMEGIEAPADGTMTELAADDDLLPGGPPVPEAPVETCGAAFGADLTCTLPAFHAGDHDDLPF